jgi:Flp pilus assembly protein TadD
MRQISGPSSFAAAIALALGLGGCDTLPFNFNLFNPFDTNGRDGGGVPPGYEATMRIGGAALEGGDDANAVAVFRRAAELAPGQAAPFAAAGDALLGMGAGDEAIASYNSALARDPHDPRALRGLARAYLATGRPELALHPLSIALEGDPKDAAVLMLLGVANDLTGHHDAAQESYRRGLEIAPGHPGLSVDLAMSLALTGAYREAIAVLRPITEVPTAAAQERQTLALIYGLAGDKTQAGRLARMDLDEESVESNMAYYETLRALSPEARERAIERVRAPPVAAMVSPT